MRIDLHTHSNVSDGTDTPTRLVNKAASQGLDVLGLTDHDTFDGLDEALEASTTAGIRVMPGIEMSCELEGHSVHLLGYGCDPYHAPLLAELARIRVSRTNRLPAMLERLAALGMPLTEDDIMHQVGSSPSLGRPHVADALVAKGYVRDRQQAFDEFLADGGPGYVPRYGCHLRSGVDLVRQARGVAVLAHPWGRGREALLQPHLVEELALEYGLDGLEVDHPDHGPEQRAGLRELAGRLGMIVTGSSDHHGLGKVGHALACETTAPDQFEELERRLSARGGRL